MAAPTRTTVRKSAPLLLTGFLMYLLAVPVALAGSLTSILTMGLSRGTGSTPAVAGPAVIVAGILAGAGMIAMLVGAYRATAAMDYLAERAGKPTSRISKLYLISLGGTALGFVLAVAASENRAVLAVLGGLSVLAGYVLGLVSTYRTFSALDFVAAWQKDVELGRRQVPTYPTPPVPSPPGFTDPARFAPPVSSPAPAAVPPGLPVDEAPPGGGLPQDGARGPGGGFWG